LIRIACLLAASLIAACASTPAAPVPAKDRRAPTSEPSPDALVVALRDARGADLVAAEGRLVALGERSAPALRRALPKAEGEFRMRVLGALDELGSIPDDVSTAARTDLLLWRLRGGVGGASDRARAVARLPSTAPEVRDELAARDGSDAADRPLALFALALSGDPRAVEILSDALSTDVGAVRRAAAAGLLRLTGVDWLEADLAERARLRREWSAEGRQG